MKEGFTLIAIIITVAIIAILVAGGLSLRGGDQQSTIEVGTQAIERAEDVRDLIEERNAVIE